MVGGRDMNGLGCIFAKTKTQDPCNVEQSWEVRDEKEYIDDTSIVVDECPAGTVHKGVNFFFAFCCTPCAYIQLINQILIKEDFTWGSWGH